MSNNPMVLRPMLAKPAATSKLAKFCHDDRYFADQKVDGHRLLIHAGGGMFHPSSRNGLTYPVTAELEACFKQFIDSEVLWIFDGEWLNRTFYIFDLPEVGNTVTTDMPFETRRMALEGFFAQWQPAQCVQLIPIARTTEEKIDLATKVVAQRGEGLMFKLRDGKYSEGKRTDAILKVKFRFDVDCVVTGVGRGGKANIVLSMVRDGALVEVAECTALAGDKDAIKVGDVVSVRCMYATADNRLYQPTLPRIRTDKTPPECTWDQLDSIRPDKTVLQ